MSSILDGIDESRDGHWQPDDDFDDLEFFDFDDIIPGPKAEPVEMPEAEQAVQKPAAASRKVRQPAQPRQAQSSADIFSQNLQKSFASFKQELQAELDELSDDAVLDEEPADIGTGRAGIPADPVRFEDLSDADAFFEEDEEAELTAAEEGRSPARRRVVILIILIIIAVLLVLFWARAFGLIG